MRAIQLEEFGGALALGNVADPVANSGEEVVDLVFAAVNPLDIWACQGNFGSMTPLPHIPGAEGIGRVGSQVVLLRGAGLGVARPGTYAQQVAFAKDLMVPVPDGVDLAQAAALGIAGLTAWRCVFDKANVQSGDLVLVLGASGGVGSLAVQLAKATGATVIGQTSNPQKASMVAASGADDVVLVDDPADLAQQLQGRTPTVVIDGLAGNFVRRSIDVMANDGRYVNFGTSSGSEVNVDMRVLYRKGITLYGYTGLRETDTTAAFNGLFASVANGTLRVQIDDVLPLSHADEAHQRILQRAVSGKLLLDVQRT